MEEKVNVSCKTDENGYLVCPPSSLVHPKGLRSRKNRYADDKYVPGGNKKERKKFNVKFKRKKKAKEKIEIPYYDEVVEFSSWPNSRPLLNTSMNCYLNAILQGLVGLESFVNYLLNLENLPEDSAGVELSELDDPVRAEYLRGIMQSMMLGLMDYGNDEPLDTSCVFPFLEGVHGIIQGEQCDANDCLLALLEVLQVQMFDIQIQTTVSCKVCLKTSLPSMPSEKEISCGLTPEKGTILTPIAVQFCLDQYFKTETFDDLLCESCAATEGSRSVSVVRAPECLIIQLKRYEINDLNEIRKRKDFVNVNETIVLKQSNKELVQYKLRSVIHHKGLQIQSGHNTCSRKLDSVFICLDDCKPEIIKNIASGNDPYICLYEKIHDDASNESEVGEDAKESDVEPEFDVAPDVVAQEVNAEQEVVDDSSECELVGEEMHDQGEDVHGSRGQQQTIRTLVGNDLNHVPGVGIWREKLSNKYHNTAISNKKLLVMLLPKDGQSKVFLTLYRRCRRKKINILFTLTWSGSAFLEKIRCDPEVKEKYVLFAEEVGTKYTAVNINQTYAEACLQYILYSFLHKNKAGLEFIFDANPECAVPAFAQRYWKDIKQDVIKSVRRLAVLDSLFCLKSCFSQCVLNNDTFHRSLAGMKQLDLSSETSEASSIDSWRFLKKHQSYTDHPLQSLLNFPTIEDDGEKETIVVKHLQDCVISEIGPFFVYMLMVVNAQDDHEPDDLFRLWSDNVTEFGIYVGMCRNGPFRKEHLLTEEQGGTTSVSKSLKRGSKVYLAVSEQFDEHVQAGKAEAQLIGILRARKDEQLNSGVGRRFDCLNIILPGLPLFESTSEEKSKFDAFLNSGMFPFRFTKEEYEECEYESGMLKRHLVAQVVPRRVETSNVIEPIFQCTPPMLEVPARIVKEWSGTRKIKKISRNVAYEPKLIAKGLRCECPMCGRILSTAAALVKHTKVHRRKPFQCTKCLVCFVDKNSLTRHELKHIAKPPRKCPTCGIVVASSTKMLNHLKEHTGLHPFQCSICEKTLSSSRSLDRHQKTHTGDKSLRCGICSKTFPNRHVLRLHSIAHTAAEKKHQCKFCMKRFGTKALLRDHEFRHTGVKPFVCSVCGRGFATGFQRTSHEYIHADVKRFRCKICRKPYKSKISLLRHERNHSKTGEKVMYECRYCSKKLSFPNTLKMHEQIHTGKVYHRCDECGKEFVQRGSALAHFRTYHAGQVVNIINLEDLRSNIVEVVASSTKPVVLSGLPLVGL